MSVCCVRAVCMLLIIYLFLFSRASLILNTFSSQKMKKQRQKKSAFNGNDVYIRYIYRWRGKCTYYVRIYSSTRTGTILYLLLSWNRVMVASFFIRQNNFMCGKILQSFNWLWNIFSNKMFMMCAWFSSKKAASKWKEWKEKANQIATLTSNNGNQTRERKWKNKHLSTWIVCLAENETQ